MGFLGMTAPRFFVRFVVTARYLTFCDSSHWRFRFRSSWSLGTDPGGGGGPLVPFRGGGGRLLGGGGGGPLAPGGSLGAIGGAPGGGGPR